MRWVADKTKRICRLAQPGTGAVHGIGHIIRGVPRDVFPHRIAEQLTARFLRTPREPFRAFEHIVWDGNRSFQYL
jgi:hypothetical protein